METLYLCEKPSQARKLAKVLGASNAVDGGYQGNGSIVTYCFGSMLSLAAPEHYTGSHEWRIDELPITPNKWDATVIPSAQEQFDRIGALLAKSGRAVIATDPDDAGEVIGRMVIAAHSFKGEIKRLWVSALDNNSLSSGLKTLRDLSETESYYRSGLVRMKMDWLFGMNLTRAFSLIRNETSKIGRVKTGLLARIVQKEREIAGFMPSPVYNASFVLNGATFDWVGAAKANCLPAFEGAAKCLSVVDDVVEAPAPSPYTLSALLVFMADNGFSLAASYQAAQALYEGGFISYPRTSCDKLPSGAATGFANHHAIIPVSALGQKAAGISQAESFMYQAITRNYEENLFGAAILRRRMVVMSVGGQMFTHVEHWLACDEDAGWLLRSNENLMRFRGKKPLSGIAAHRAYPVSVRAMVGNSMPPARFTEATLLDYMAKNNIGTEATRVGAISSLYEDGVAELEDSEIRSTARGERLIDSLPPSILGDAMSLMVRDAVLSARLSGDCSTHLAKAADWLKDSIPEVAAC